MQTQEILDSMALNGLRPLDLTLDGRVHRFKIDSSDKGTAGWYCGFQNFSRTGGAEFQVVTYGNFKTGIVHKYQTDMTFGADDVKYIKDQIEKAKAKADQERRQVQLEVAVECEEIWSTLSTEGTVPYLSSKQLTVGLQGARVEISPHGPLLWVPMRDIDGKLWSLQSISSDSRGKKFYPGGKIEGCFHTFGDLEASEKIIIAEGYATSYSIYMASDVATVCAFNSNNLEKVASLLKRRFPEKLFIIAGDDDRWTTNSKDEPWNPGKEAAEASAKATMGKAIFPKFKLLQKGKTTDFNDLHCIEGLDEVREQIKAIEVKRYYVVPLGYDGSDYFFISSENPQIQRISMSSLGSSAGLFRLQPMEYWENQYPSVKGEGIAFTRAASELSQACHAKGIFKPDHVRGCGVWNDSERIVYHMGTRLWVQGKEEPLHRNSLGSRYIYESSESLPGVHKEPLDLEACQDLVAAAKHIRWSQEESYMLFLGWLAIAPIAGCLPWRPHVWLTGASGSGKSYIMQKITYVLLQDFAKYFRGNTSEAGIRQIAGRSTQPIIFDEFETNDEKSGERIKSILELARQASSDSDGIVAKGTVGGNAVQFKPQFSMMVASVRLNLVHEEDENRFTVLEVARGEANDREQFETLQAFVKVLDREYGHRLMSRSLNKADTIKASSLVFQNEICEKFPMRIGQQYGGLLAGFWSLISDEAVTPEKAKQLIAGMKLESANETALRNDETECLDHLMNRIIRGDSIGYGMFEGSIREMILGRWGGTGTPKHEFNDSLERHGITRSGDHIAIHANHNSIKDFFKGSKWSGNYAKQMQRMTGVTMSEARFKTTQTKARCIKIPLSLILNAGLD